MEVVPKSVRWLLPEEPCPCDIFLHFRGQYAVALSGGQPVPFKLLEKLAKARFQEIYVRASDLAAWDAWAATRRPNAAPAGDDAEEKDDLYGNKRAELLSYVQKSLLKKIEGNAALDRAFVEATALLQKVVRQPSLDWYFKKFHEPPDLFQHNARVAYGIAIFLHTLKVASAAEMEAICYSALIHELEGEPAANFKTVVSQQTLALLEKNRHPVPAEVIEMIELHDELCSGQGFPNNKTREEIPVSVRLFTLFNHFDAYRCLHTGTRRARFDRARESMTARQADYDPSLWTLFWHFWEKQVEAVH